MLLIESTELPFEKRNQRGFISFSKVWLTAALKGRCCCCCF